MNSRIYEVNEQNLLHVFLIFTTRVSLNTRLNGVKLILFEQSRHVTFGDSNILITSTLFPLHPLKILWCPGRRRPFQCSNHSK